MRKKLKNARKEKGYTQEEMAKYLNITLRHYQSLEAGTSEGSVGVWKRLREKLEAKSIDDLLE